MEKFKFNKKTNELFKAVISLKTMKEAEVFFRDLCTIDELKEMSERWQIARMVNRGLPYREIAKKLDVSTTTVARVALWLNNGAGGYQLILNRQNFHHNSSCAFKKS